MPSNSLSLIHDCKLEFTILADSGINYSTFNTDRRVCTGFRPKKYIGIDSFTLQIVSIPLKQRNLERNMDYGFGICLGKWLIDFADGYMKYLHELASRENSLEGTVNYTLQELFAELEKSLADPRYKANGHVAKATEMATQFAINFADWLKCSVKNEVFQEGLLNGARQAAKLEPQARQR